MSTKNELIPQLTQLAQQLGRTISTTGTVEELNLRLREAREELEALGETAGVSSATVSPGADHLTDENAPKTRLSAAPVDYVTVRARKTLHIRGWDPQTGRPVRLVLEGAQVMVEADDLPALQGLVSEA